MVFNKNQIHPFCIHISSCITITTIFPMMTFFSWFKILTPGPFELADHEEKPFHVTQCVF